MKAGLSAQVLGAWAQPVARAPSAQAQLSSLFIGHKPVVGLLLFRCADVARYRLPDHRNSSSPHSLPAVSSNPGVAPFPCMAGATAAAPADRLEQSRKRLLLFHRAQGEIGEVGREGISGRVKLERWLWGRPETGQPSIHLRLSKRNPSGAEQAAEKRSEE